MRRRARWPAKVSFIVDPDNPYPNQFTGHLRVTLTNGRVIEKRRANMRGGAHDPLSQADIIAKFRANARFGGWQDGQAGALEAAFARIADGGRCDLSMAGA